MKYVQVCFEPMFWSVKKGGSQEMRRRFEALSRIESMEIAAYSFTKEFAKKDIETYIKKRLTIFALILPFPVAVRLPSREMVNYLNQADDKIVFIEGLQSSFIYFFLNKATKSVCYLRIHNWESRYHLEMCRDSSGLRRVAHLIVFLQYFLYEKFLLSKGLRLAHISEEEMTGMAKSYKSSYHFLLPPIANAAVKAKITVGKFDGLLILGDLSIAGNLKGAVWFCNEIWPHIIKKYPNLSMHIIGINSTAVSGAGIISHGYVEDLEGFLEKHRLVSIIAVAGGGGVKIKTIDTMATGMPAVYSKKSLEGLRDQEGIMTSASVYDHGDVQSALSACMRVLSDPQQAFRDAETLKKYCQNHYSEESFITAVSKVFKYPPVSRAIAEKNNT